jgi:hypothetical protein
VVVVPLEGIENVIGVVPAVYVEVAESESTKDATIKSPFAEVVKEPDVIPLVAVEPVATFVVPVSEGVTDKLDTSQAKTVASPTLLGTDATAKVTVFDPPALLNVSQRAMSM